MASSIASLKAGALRDVKMSSCGISQMPRSDPNLFGKVMTLLKALAHVLNPALSELHRSCAAAADPLHLYLGLPLTAMKFCAESHHG